VAPNDICILITGESGTGKEVIANLVHALSLQAKGPLVKINCAALPRELIESELFGSVKGAYTGSVASRKGLLAEASGGTLFLDEIAEMPLGTQAKLLRVLQYKEFRPVGGTVNTQANCRIIAATNREVLPAIKDAHLRADLYYRIGAITLHLAPLRERPEDILPLAELFIRRSAAQFKRPITGLTLAAVEAIQRFPWPGNIRQLENEMQRAVLMCEHAQIGVSDLSVELPHSQEIKLHSPLERAEKEVILAMLRECAGNKRETARKLGIARPTLYKKLADYGIEVSKSNGDESATLSE
jgi:transcriptional regulator with PAS, ATPase and Fis domain